MKKITKLLLPLLFLPFFVNAQLNIGIKGGLNYANIDDNYASINGSAKSFFKARTAYHFGVFAQTTFYDKLTFRGELLYSFEGGELRDNLLSNSENGHIDYLNLPLLVRVNLLSFLYIEAGVEPGIIVRGRDLTFDKNAEIGGVLGAGIRLGSKLGVNLRYIHGLTDLRFPANDQNGQPIGTTEGQVRMLQAAVEIYFLD